MTWVAAAVVGGTALVGGAMSADAARSAGNQQANAANNATNAQMRMFGTVNDQNAPFRDSANISLGQILQGFGAAPTPAMTTSSLQSDPRYQAIYNAAVNDFDQAHQARFGMSIWDPRADAASRDATLARYKDQAAQNFIQQYGSTATDAPAAPSATASNAGGVSDGYFTHQFNADDLKSSLAPNYQFQLDQGLGALKNAGNLQTGLISGNTLKGINDYAQNYAGGAYQQAFNNFTANQNNIFNRLSTVAGLGSNANATTAEAGANISGNAANTMVGAGTAQAAGTVGQANALAGAANNAASWYALSSFMKPNQQPIELAV